MSHAKRSSKPSVPPLKIDDESKALSDSRILAKELIDYLTTNGLPLSEACARAGYLLKSPIGESGIVTLPNSDYDNDPKRKTMTTATKSNGHKKNGNVSKRPSNLPAGSMFHQVFARGLTRWRLSQGIPDIKTAITKYQYGQSWYDVEKGVSGSMTGTHINIICERIGVPFMEILNLGLAE